MAINLQPLFEKQRQLDEYIVKTKGLEGQDLLPNKILALQVELGELANEWRGFKHWSDNKNPVYTAQIDCPVCHGKGFKEAATFAYGCNRCGGTGYLVKHPLLEEYVDCLHFILSIGLEINIPDEWDTEIEPVPEPWEIREQFILIIESTAKGFSPFTGVDPDNWFELTENFLALGMQLGFTWEEIEAAYDAKWQENIRRQQIGY